MATKTPVLCGPGDYYGTSEPTYRGLQARSQGEGYSLKGYSMLPASSVARNRGKIIATGLWGTSYFYSTRKDCCGMILNTMFSNKDEGTEDKNGNY